MLNTLKMDILFDLKRKVIFIGVFLLAILIVYADYSKLSASHGTPLSIGDLAAKIYGGIPPYVYEPGKRFEIPTTWIFVFICPCLISLYYAYSATHGFGLQLLVRTPSRSAWLREKIIWIACNTVIIVLLEIFLITIFSSVSHQSLPTADFNEINLSFIEMKILPGANHALVIVEMFTVEFLYVFLLSSLSYLLASVVGFLGSLITFLSYMFITMFTDLPIMICTRIMFARSEPFLLYGDNMTISIILALIIAVGILLLTKIVARYMKLD